MKIDKIVFCCSEEFSPFWNLQSYLWKTMFNIEPVCLLWGKIKNTNMTEKYGQIIEKQYNDELIRSFQMTWSKFHHTKSDLESTWIIGDIDLVPLQTDWFVGKLKTLDDDVYTHLAYGEIPRQAGRGLDVFPKMGGFVNGGADIAAYYHVGKGKVFTVALGLDECSFDEQVRRVISDGRFGMGPTQGMSHEQTIQKFSHVPIARDELYYWCADENYSSYRIHEAQKKNLIRFAPHITPLGHPVDRLDRYWMQGNLYMVNPDQVKNKGYIDIHCDRPFSKQKDSLKWIVETAWGGWNE